MSDQQFSAHNLVELHTHHSEKWRAFPQDVLPLPVAEMDFPVAEPIKAILTEMVAHSDLGYLGPIPELGLGFKNLQQSAGTGRLMKSKFVQPQMLVLQL